MGNYEILRKDFNVQIHKENFINYLEVVIHKDGKIEYAVPSHSKKMEIIVCEKYNLEFDYEYFCSKALIEMFVKTGRYLWEWKDWLLEESEVILVRHNGYEGQANDKQLETLRMLKEEGLYLGIIGNKEVY
jgi:hypothetical protein